jgi:ABC-type antimicrobial peptide transport system permease subunit
LSSFQRWPKSTNGSGCRTPDWLALLSILGVIALILATTGLYAVVSYIMNMRAREIAIRLTLGAERGDVFRMIFRQAMTMVTIGTILGGVIAYAASQVIRSQAEGVRELDKLAFGGSVLVLLVPMVFASMIPRDAIGPRKIPAGGVAGTSYVKRC